MVTPLHEGLAGIAKLDPVNTACALRELFDLDIPKDGDAVVASPDLTKIQPTEYRADGVLLYSEDGGRKLAVIVEVQLKRDPDKHGTWLAYIANVRVRDKCPACLVVICKDSSTAKWAAAPIETGHPGLTLTPLVIGPDNTPVITDIARAVGNIGLAAISAITHSKHPEINIILATLVDALASIDSTQAQEYADFVTVALTGSAQKEMERLMTAQTHRFQSEYAQKLRAEGRDEGRDEGRAIGEARSVLRLLEFRKVEVSDSARERILACTEEAQLYLWLEKASYVTSVEDLFD
ncbi:hypothetical protein [Acrocarpospora catenulata]|uniref:hypothetical protein n=1 Tax=Acrocarpospora catenulata TaxID=2836182 RepID=UPI001BDA8C00|nr:hypothetical protein [Acrocarpospora catenulata]